LPDLHRPVLASCSGEMTPVGAELDIEDFVLVTDELKELSRSRDIPDRRHLVLARARQAAPTPVERDLPDRGCMTGQCVTSMFTGLAIPEVHGIVAVSSGEQLSVAAECNRIDLHPMRILRRIHIQSPALQREPINRRFLVEIPNRGRSGANICRSQSAAIGT